MRAVIERREAAYIVGVDVDRVQAVELRDRLRAARRSPACLLSMLEQFSPFSGFPFTIAGVHRHHPGRPRQCRRRARRGAAARRARDLWRGADLGEPALGAALRRLRRLRCCCFRTACLRAAPCAHEPALRWPRSWALALALGALPFVANDYLVGIGLTPADVAGPDAELVRAVEDDRLRLARPRRLLRPRRLPRRRHAGSTGRCALAVPAAGIVAALFAVLVGLPVLRVRGPYFVILTFGRRRARQVRPWSPTRPRAARRAASCSARPTSSSSTSRCCAGRWRHRAAGAGRALALRPRPALAARKRGGGRDARRAGRALQARRLRAVGCDPRHGRRRHGLALDLFRGRPGVRSDDLGHRHRDGADRRWRRPRGPVLGALFLVHALRAALGACAAGLHADPRRGPRHVRAGRARRHRRAVRNGARAPSPRRAGAGAA